MKDEMHKDTCIKNSFDDIKASKILNVNENIDSMKFDLTNRTGSLVDVRLPPIEMYRDSSVLNEIIKKLEVISVLPYIIENKEKLRNVLGNELVENLERHKIILDAFKQLKDNKGKLDEENEQSRSSDIDDSTVLEVDKLINEVQSGRPKQNQLNINNLDLVIQKLKFSTRIILRSFIHNSLILKTTLSDKKTVSQNVQDFTNHIKSLKYILTKNASMSEEEIMSKLKAFNSINGQRDCNDQINKRLQNDILLIQKEMQDQLSREEEKANELKMRIKTMNSEHEESLKSINSKSKKQEIVCLKNHECKMKKVIEEVKQVELKFEAALNFHFSEEKQLRKKKYKVEAEFEDAIQSYDREMMDRQKEIEEIEALYSREKEMLEITEQKFQLLEVKYEQVMEEKRMNEKKLHAEQLEMQRLVRAVTTIQSMWRSYKVNRSIKARKKKMAAGRRKSVMKKSKLK